jgi:hypothetical protein
LDGGEDGANVDVGVHAGEGFGGAGADSHAEVGGPPIAELGIGGEGGGSVLDADGTTPVMADFGAVGVALFACGAPGIVGVAESAGIGADHDESGGFLGIGGGEQAAHGAALGDAAQDGALRSGSFHDGADIVHALFQGWEAG